MAGGLDVGIVGMDASVVNGSGTGGPAGMGCGFKMDEGVARESGSKGSSVYSLRTILRTCRSDAQ